MATRRIKKGTTIQGGIAPKGNTQGNSSSQEDAQDSPMRLTPTSKKVPGTKKVLLQKARVRKAEIARDKARQTAEERSPSLGELRREKTVGKF